MAIVTKIRFVGSNSQVYCKKLSWLFNPALIYDCLVIRETRNSSKPKKIQTNRHEQHQIPAQAMLEFYININSV